MWTYIDSPALFYTRNGERASANNVHWAVSPQRKKRNITAAAKASRAPVFVNHGIELFFTVLFLKFCDTSF